MNDDRDLHDAYMRLRYRRGALTTSLAIMRELDPRAEPVGWNRDAFDLRMLDAGYLYIQIDGHNVWRRREDLR